MVHGVAISIWWCVEVGSNGGGKSTVAMVLSGGWRQR